MDWRLKNIIDDVKGRSSVRSNPDEWDFTDAGIALQLEILRSGLATEFTEADVIEAAKRVGVSDMALPGFLEQFASWL